MKVNFKMITDGLSVYYAETKFRIVFELNKIEHNLREILLIFRNRKKVNRHLKIP